MFLSLSSCVRAWTFCSSVAYKRAFSIEIAICADRMRKSDTRSSVKQPSERLFSKVDGGHQRPALPHRHAEQRLDAMRCDVGSLRNGPCCDAWVSTTCSCVRTT